MYPQELVTAAANVLISLLWSEERFKKPFVGTGNYTLCTCVGPHSHIPTRYVCACVFVPRAWGTAPEYCLPPGAPRPCCCAPLWPAAGRLGVAFSLNLES